MCAQYTLKVELTQLKALFQIESKLVVIDERFLPYKTAPVLVESQSKTLLSAMNFSLIPSWSTEPKVKFATHNARIETVEEKPTWKIPFERQHCIVPMTVFYESAYEGPLAGHIVAFEKQDQSLLLAAGIYDRWVDPARPNHPKHSFSILTTTPTSFIVDHGHDRSPIFLSEVDSKKWLKMKGPGREQKDFITSQLIRPELIVKKDRAMKPGWEKRK